MKKVSLQLPTGEWDDLRTKYAADDNRLVDQNAFTEGTKNIDTESDGTIRKMKGGTQFYTLASANKDQHEAIFSDGTRHLLTVDGGDLRFTAGEPSSTSVTSGYSTAGNFEFSTYQDRVYFGNAINTNQVYDKTATYGGVAYSVPQTKDMGAQVPGSAATAALGAAGSAVPAGGHTYKITFLYYDSEESNGSAASNLVTVTGANEQVDLTSIPIGGYGVTARKIYRDDNDGVYVLVGTLSDNTTTIFSDLAAGGTTPIPTDNGIPPTFGQVKLFLERLWFAQIAGEPFTLYFSEVGFPDIVQSTNFIDCNPEDPITALTVYRGRLVVFNRRSMGQILGDTKDSFRYDTIESSVGCVDNRTVQEIVLNGVPVLVWLSDKGFYGFNGSSIFYLSDSIEDLINVNIKQAVIQKNQNVDTNNADFLAGTSSDGIAVAGGAFSVRGYVDGTSTVGNNPRRTWNDTADWDGGDSLDNVATIGLSNVMQPVSGLSEVPGTEGTRDNVIASGSDITLSTETPFTGETGGNGNFNTTTTGRSHAFRFIPTRSGTLTAASMSAPGSLSYTLYSDGGSTPGSALGSFIGQAVSGGTAYWMVVTVVAGSTAIGAGPSGSSFTSGGSAYAVDEPGGGISFAPSGGLVPDISYSITADPVAKSGTWTSSIFDSQSNSANAKDITHSSTFPALTGATTTINAGDNLDFAGNIIVDETESFTDLSGTSAVTLGTRRYWQVKITLTTDDDTVAPTVASPVVLDFEDAAVWISDSVDTTADSTVYDSLVTTSLTPGASTVVTEIRTAATLGALSGATWFTFGAHTVDKFAQIRITMTSDGDNIPSVSSVELKWTIVSNLISEEIDTTVDPAGWDIFRETSTLNGGTVVFEMRSATTSPGLSGAAWSTVTNGNYPPAALPTDRFVQWRATITASDTTVPSVTSVTIAWLVGSVDSVRAASIFFNKNYYVALAELGNDNNNIIIQLDAKGKWRIKRGLGVNTFGYFFNDPYFGQSTAGVIGKFLEGLSDLGTDIEIDIRTRALDFSSNFFDNSQFTKVPESFMLEGRGTGATYDVSYSTDGINYTNFVDVVTGSTTFTTTNDDQLFSRVFRATDNNGARAVYYRIHTNDEFDVKIHRFKMSAFITRREPIITG